MQRLALDPDALAVATFDPAPAAAMALSGDTNDEICLALTLLTEDCFGPTAGCTIETQA
jgi:hypothetical protein